MPNPRKGFLLRVPEALLNELRALAESEMRSLNAQIEWILRDALRRRGRPADAAKPAEDAEPDDNAERGDNAEREDNAGHDEHAPR